MRIELTTPCLRDKCSATELRGQYAKMSFKQIYNQQDREFFVGE